MSLVDSHCHLDNPRFAADFEEVLRRAAEAGVDRMLSIGTGEGPQDLDCALKVALRYPHVFASAGLHPHDAAKADDASFGFLRQVLSNDKCVAVGEIGLDYHYDFSPRSVQQQVFEEQLHIAREARKPVIIHTREAWADTMSTLKKHWQQGAAVVHCFTGTPEEALEAVQLGFYLGIGGVLTFPKSGVLRDAVRAVPLNRLLLETDAPYLAPVPHRAKRNEPAFTSLTAQKMAEVRECSVDEVARQTTANFETLFHLPRRKPNGYTEGSHGTR